MSVSTRSLRNGGLLLATTILVLAATAPAHAIPPAGKKYAIVLMVTNPETGEVETERACAIFRRSEWCTENVECGPWEMTEELGPRNEFTLRVQLEEAGELIDAVGYGVTERRGSKSSIGGTFIYTLEGVMVNAGVAGTQTTRSRCLDWADSDE